MNSVWKQFKYSVQADLHTIFYKKEDKNPIAMLNQYIRLAEKKTESIGKLIDRQVKLKNELEKELTQASTMATKRRAQLELAQVAGERDLIVFAEEEILAYDTRTETLTTCISETVNELILLERKFEEMKHKVKGMKIRQLQLMGKENVTRAHRRMDQIISPENDESTIASVSELKKYIDSLGKKIDSEYEDASMERRLESLTKTTVTDNEINTTKETELV